MNLKRRKKLTDYRSGQAQRFLDAVQALMDLQYCKDFLLPITGDGYLEPKYNPKVVSEMRAILGELWSWNITEVGDLYLTSGGRIVLDKGFGEYFTEGDKKVFSREELHSGVKYKEFLKRLGEVGK